MAADVAVDFDTATRDFRHSPSTENGAIMAATILNSPRALEMNVFVVRAFVSIRSSPSGWAARFYAQLIG